MVRDGSKMFFLHFHPLSLYQHMSRSLFTNHNLPKDGVDRHIRGTRTQGTYGVGSENDPLLLGIKSEVNMYGRQHLRQVRFTKNALQK